MQDITDRIFVSGGVLCTIIVCLSFLLYYPDRTRDRQIAEAVEKVEYSVKINGRSTIQNSEEKL